MSFVICVFCASSDLIPKRYIDLAGDLGTQIAARGHTLVTGGGSVSCMGAVARAARAGGARTIGVIPRGLLASEVADEDSDELLVTDDMRTRKAAMDARADAFIALPGGLGTLEELIEIWVARTLRMHDKPVVVCDPDGVYAHLRAQVEHLVADGFARPQVHEAITWVETASEALDAIESAVRRAERQAPPTEREVLEAEP